MKISNHLFLYGHSPHSKNVGFRCFCARRNPTSFFFLPCFAGWAGELKNKRPQREWKATGSCSLPSQGLQELLCPGWFKNGLRGSLDGWGVMPWKTLSLAGPCSEIHPRFFLLGTRKKEAADLSSAKSGLEIKAENNWGGDHHKHQIWMENILRKGENGAFFLLLGEVLGLCLFFPLELPGMAPFSDLDLAQQRPWYLHPKPPPFFDLG